MNALVHNRVSTPEEIITHGHSDEYVACGAQRTSRNDLPMDFGLQPRISHLVYPETGHDEDVARKAQNRQNYAKEENMQASREDANAVPEEDLHKAL